ncbi:MAG: type II toxin-antitoxin system RelE/ParE family toxin [Rhodospirillales bacterium]
MDILEYVDASGRRPFRRWFDGLDWVAAAKVLTALSRMELGNLSNAKSVGGGVYEYRIDFGPGYRLYFGYDGPRVVILLGGGTKRNQSNDIATANARWADYRTTKGAATWH